MPARFMVGHDAHWIRTTFAGMATSLSDLQLTDHHPQTVRERESIEVGPARIDDQHLPI